MYLNLLFKAIKSDSSLPRQSAFVKRVIQILGLHQPQFICGALYLMGEVRLFLYLRHFCLRTHYTDFVSIGFSPCCQVFTAAPGLRRLVAEPEDDDEEEHFVDAPDSEDEGAKKESVAPVKKWDTAYDGKKREPQYAHAENSCLWELVRPFLFPVSSHGLTVDVFILFPSVPLQVPFLSHFHPSVSLLASQLIDNVPLTGSSDLNLNTLIHFLDRFVYRNAKKLKAKGASIMQPAAISDRSSGVLNLKGPGAGVEVNSKEFWSQKVEDVPVDQVRRPKRFFFQNE